jgi:hypothetical protein
MWLPCTHTMTHNRRAQLSKSSHVADPAGALRRLVRHCTFQTAYYEVMMLFQMIEN